jgi:hypothetical protein
MKRFAVLLLTALVVSAPVYARGKKVTSTEPGKYKAWGPDIDEIEIVKKFSFADYDKVVVQPLDTGDTPLPESKDNTYEPVKKVLASVTEGLVQGLRGAVTPQVSIDESAEGAGTLLIRGKVIEMDPGSKAARYWAGFGAGAARAKLELEIVDAKTNDVLVRFTQERRSGVGMFGGDYQELMQRNLNQIGEDTAKLLKAF